ncbi:MAG TPA: maleylpyruvate isomerase family mycothiol-dependent enzyme [Actinomycetales bacterium]|nr:maleylpyruvate isomerase family mycothiol-dependent enzyme [Actinomycetales bacterium]
MPLTEEAYLGNLERDAAAVSACIDRGPMSAPVAGCPGWDLRQLVVHLGRTHRWATAALASTDQPAYPPRPDDARLAEWFAEGAAELLAALRSADPGRPCWSFSPDTGTVAFWVRRQAQETAVHRWDAQHALGRADRIDATLAADGVDEVARVFYPRQVAMGRREPLGTAVTLRPDDAGEPVLLGEGTPVAAVSGPAEDLLLALWQRRSGGDLVHRGALRVDGDRDAALRVLTEVLVP